MASSRYAKTIHTTTEELYLLIDWHETQYDIVVSDGRDCWEKQDVPCNAPPAFKHGDEQWRARVHEALCCPAKGCTVSFQFQSNHIAAKRALELSWSWQESSNVRGKSLATVTLPPAADGTATMRTMLHILCSSHNDIHGAHDGLLKQIGSLSQKLEACQNQLATFEEQKRKWEEELVWQVAELLNKHNARIAELEEELLEAEEERKNAELQHEAGTDDEDEAGTSSYIEGDTAPQAGAGATTGHMQPAGTDSAMDVDVKEEEGGDEAHAGAAPTDPSWLEAPELMDAATQPLPPFDLPAAAGQNIGNGASAPEQPIPAAGAVQPHAAGAGKSQQATAPSSSAPAVASLQGPAVKVRRRPIGGQR